MGWAVRGIGSKGLMKKILSLSLSLSPSQPEYSVTTIVYPTVYIDTDGRFHS